MILYIIARFLSFLAHALPRKSLYLLAGICGDMLYLAWRTGRHNARENMLFALGPGASRRQIDRAAHETLRNFTRYYAEFLHGQEKLLGRTSCSGLENVDQALAGGQGVILVSMHMGSPELAGFPVIHSQHILNVVVDSQFGNDRVNRWIQRLRAKSGMTVIAANKGVLPNLMRTLRRNEALALLIDCPHLGNIDVKFCGTEAKVPGGTAALALRTGAKIVPMSSMRTKGNHFITCFDKPLDFKPSGNFSSDVKALTQRIMDSMEQKVRDYPDQWFMFQNMWVAG